MQISVVGAGAWGTTMASALARRNNVVLWALEPEVADDVNERHRNQRFLPDIDLDPDVRATNDLADALAGAEAILVAVPSEHFRAVLSQAAPMISPATPVLTLTKGIEVGSLLRMSQVAAEVLPGHRRDLIGVLSGPNIARLVARGDPAATVVALPDPAWADRLQAALSTPSLRVYTNPDVTGCELGGAVKNVIALAAGMASGLGYGENTLAAVVTRGLAELARLGVSQGGQPLTFLGLAGIGDLVVTCNSPSSRNHHVGVELGRGRSLEDVLSEMSAVAEGVRTCQPVLELGRRAGVELPICEVVGKVLGDQLTAAQAVEVLLGRDSTAELHDLDPPGRADPSSGS